MILVLSSLYLVFYYSNKSEKDRLWTGLAKETAHQLGTPLSSLIGWNEYIKSKGMKWLVVESIPVHESIKYGGSDREIFINNYIESIKNISKAGINILCYNCMIVFVVFYSLPDKENLYHERNNKRVFICKYCR